MNRQSDVGMLADLNTLNRFDTNNCLIGLPVEYLANQSNSSESDWKQHMKKEIKTPQAHLTEQLAVALNQIKILKDLTIFHLDLIEKQKEMISKRDEMCSALQEEIDKLRAKITENDTRTELSQRQSNRTSTIRTSTIDFAVPDSKQNKLYKGNLSIPDQKTAFRSFKVLRPETRIVGPVITQVGNLNSAVIHPDLNNLTTVNHNPLLDKEDVKTESCSMALSTTITSGNPVMQRVPKSKVSVIGNIRQMNKPETITSKSKFNNQDQSNVSTYNVNNKKEIIDISEKSQNTSTIPKQSTQLTKPQSDTQQPKKVEQTMIFQEPYLELVKTEAEFSWSIYNDKPDDENPSKSNKGNMQAPSEGSDKAAIMPLLDADEFQELFTLDSTGLNSDYLNQLNENLIEIAPEETKIGSDGAPSSMVPKMNVDSKCDVSKRSFKKRSFSNSSLGKKQPKESLSKKKFRKKNPEIHENTSPVPSQVTTKPYHTLVGDSDQSWYLGLDPELKHEDIDQLTYSSQTSTIEVPSWRKKIYTCSYVAEGTEKVDDEVFKKRHRKPEAKERQVQRWHRQRVKEQLRKENRGKRQISLPVTPVPLYTIWPRPADVQAIEITHELPITTFGEPLPLLLESDFKLPWVRTSKALKRSKRSKTQDY